MSKEFQGTVKFYDSKKRHFGYIKRKKGKDLYFDRRSFEGFIPKEGDLVLFKISRTEKGEKAIDVRLDKQKSTEPCKENGDPKDIIGDEGLWYMPTDSKEILTEANAFREVDNFYLQLGKYLQRDTQNKFQFPTLPEDFKYLMSYKSSYEGSLVQNLKLIHITAFSAETASRLLIGLGNPSVLENNLTLHHIYGFPYIPGSAIKGMLRNYFIKNYFDHPPKDDELALQDQGFCDIFGCPEKSYYKKACKGKIYFFDAIPKLPPAIEKDIMTPHYREYYEGKGKKAPADYYDPNPIPFIGVASHTKFKFFLGIEKANKDYNIVDGKFKDSNLLSLVKNKLQKALETFGIGAKTAVGYGYFFNFQPNYSLVAKK